MARIPEHEIERLKREVSLERLVEAQGIKLKRHGADLLGLCPFHDDREPSLVVSPKKNLWHCLGACNAGGSVIDWVIRSRGVSFRHAVELLRADHPSLAAPLDRVVRKSTTEAVKLEAPIRIDAEDDEALRQTVDYYHETLQQSPEALGYLARRGLDHPEMLGRFRLGFANRTLGYRLPEKNRKAGAEIRGRLQRLGVLRRSGHEHFNGSVVVPVIDGEGRVREIYGRKITAGLRAGTPLHLYLPGPHRGVWNEEALEVSKEIILCESLLDALAFWCADYRHVTASYGVNGFTDDHREAFRKHGVKKVLLAYDRDAAGEKAAGELAEELLSTGVECYRVLFPKDLDANAYAAAHRPASESLGRLLNQAQWLGKGKRPTTGAPARQPEPPSGSEQEEAAKEEKPEEPDEEPNEPREPEPASSLAASAEPEPAVPQPQAAAIDVPVEIHGEEILIRQGDRRYRIRGLAKNMSHELLRVNVLVSTGELFHVDTIDLYAARQRGLFVKQAAEELRLKEDVVKRDLGRVLLKLEELQDEQIRKALDAESETVALSAAQRAAALDLLEDPRLLDRILNDFAACGVVGERTNKLVGYLAAVSRKLDAPLAVVVQSSSAAGKSSLMDAVLAFTPEEDRVQYSAMTGQSLYYMGEEDLKHKVLAVVEEEGASRAAYALKLLQSEGALSIASTGKDPATGKLVTHQYRVEGPVMIFLTTTAIHLDEELLNRCLVLTVDEDRAQTQAIHRLQREQQTLEGLLRRKRRDEILEVHQNAQRLLRPLFVANPYAERLTFLDSRTRTRRDHVKYLTLIRVIALLHQYQRPLQTAEWQGRTIEYIEATLDDIAVANRLTAEVLGRSLDELPPQTRRLLLLIDEMVAEASKRLAMERADYRFSRRDVRAATEWSDPQLKRHLRKLEELEYLIVHRGGRGQSLVYELAFERPADPAEPFLPGLLDVEQLRGEKLPYDENRNPLAAEKDAPEGEKDPSNTPQARASRGSAAERSEPMTTGLRSALRPDRPKNAVPGPTDPPAVVIVAER